MRAVQSEIENKRGIGERARERARERERERERKGRREGNKDGVRRSSGVEGKTRDGENRSEARKWERRNRRRTIQFSD